MGKIALTLLVFVLFLSSKTNKMDLNKVKEEIKLADIAFSNYSIEHGMNKAFVKYASTVAVLLKPNRMPVIGAEEIIKYHENVNDNEITLSWNPEFIDVAESGELGYTYGFWKLTNKKDSILSEGTYLSIWKKQKDGSWKYVLDTGNSGLGE
jgi:ketosteroid isomerase-like protein